MTRQDLPTDDPILPEALWQKLSPYLPPEKEVGAKGGRPPVSNRRALGGILYVLKNGSRWRDTPRRYGSGVTCWRRLKEWQEQGVWERIHQELLAELNKEGKINWEKGFLDSSSVPAPKGGMKPALTLQIEVKKEPSDISCVKSKAFH